MTVQEVRAAALDHAVKCAVASGDSYKTDIDDIVRTAKTFEDYVANGTVPAEETEDEDESEDATA